MKEFYATALLEISMHYMGFLDSKVGTDALISYIIEAIFPDVVVIKTPALTATVARSMRQTALPASPCSRSCAALVNMEGFKCTSGIISIRIPFLSAYLLILSAIVLATKLSGFVLQS